MKKIIVLILIVIALAAGSAYWMKAGNPNALRHIVLDQCVPNQIQNRNPAPCAQVKTDAGYVVFKDRNAFGLPAFIQYQPPAARAMTMRINKIIFFTTRSLFSIEAKE